MPTVAILGEFPDQQFEDNLVQNLGVLDADLIRSPSRGDSKGLSSEIYERVFDGSPTVILVVFSEAYQNRLQSDLRFERELIVNTLQSSPSKIVPVTYEESFQPRGLFSSLQVYNVRKLGLTLLVASLRERFDAVTLTAPRLTPHPRINSALKEGFPGKKIESESGVVSLLKDNIGYELFRIEDRDFGNLYVVHTYTPIRIAATAEHFREHFGGLVGDRLFLIAHRDRTAPNEAARLENLKRGFGAKQAWYVDTFIADRLGWPPESFLADIPNPKPYFVEPRLRSPGDPEKKGTPAIAFLDAWHQSGTSILVVQGHGGIGKTQLLRKFAKDISAKRNVTVVYLDSVSILEHFQGGEILLRKFDVETLSQLIESRLGSGPVTQDRLLTLITSERFLIILDGLDEVIPRLPTGYDVTEFFASIQDVSEELGGGRMLVSCRNSFWDQSRVAGPVGVAELEAFDAAQVDHYLANRFSGDPAAKSRAEHAIKDMQHYFTGEIYPFILDLACIMTEDKEPSQALAAKSPSEQAVFDDGQVLDEVIWHVCRREAAKFGGDSSLGFEDQPLDVPLQAQLFNELALQMSQLPGEITLATARSQLEQWLGGNASEAVVTAFQSHPLLDASEDKLRFRYDFVQELFLSVVLKQTLQSKRDLSLGQALFLTGLCRLESNFLRLVARKVGALTDDVTLGISSLIDMFRDENDGEQLKPDVLNKAIGGATNIGIQCLLQPGKWDSDLGSTYLVNLFGKPGGQLEGLVLLAPNSEARIVFSFEGLILRNATILDYDNFLKCKFDNRTKFVRSVIFGGNLGEPRSDKAATASNFDDSCRVDERIRELVRAKDDRSSASETADERTLKSYLKMFRKAGTFRMPKKLETLQASVTFPTRIPFQTAIDILFQAELMVKNVGQGGKFVGINSIAIQEVEDFVEQGVQGKRIRHAIAEIQAL